MPDCAPLNLIERPPAGKRGRLRYAGGALREPACSRTVAARPEKGCAKVDGLHAQNPVVVLHSAFTSYSTETNFRMPLSNSSVVYRRPRSIGRNAPWLCSLERMIIRPTTR